MVQPFRHVAQLHEFLEILHRSIATTAIHVAHERRAINRGEHQVASTDDDIALGIARMLCELAGRRFDQLTGQTARNMHPLPLNIGACLTPPVECGRVIDEVNTDLLEDGFGVGFDDLERLFGQNLKIGNVALNVLGGLNFDGCALCTTRRAPAATSTSARWCLCHAHSP